MVIAPVLIWWKDTPSLVDWESITTLEKLNRLKVLKLRNVNKLENSYLHLEYDVVKKTRVNKGVDVLN